MFFTKNSIRNIVFLIFYGIITGNGFALSGEECPPVTFERMTTRVGGRLPLFSSQAAVDRVYRELQNFDSLNSFQKAEAQKNIFTCFWKMHFRSLEKSLDPVENLNKSIALDSGLSAIQFYEQALKQEDHRAVLPLLEMLNGFTFGEHPYVSEKVKGQQCFEADFLIKKAADVCSFEEILNTFFAWQGKPMHKCWVSIFQIKMQEKMPDLEILNLFLERIKSCCFAKPDVHPAQIKSLATQKEHSSGKKNPSRKRHLSESEPAAAVSLLENQSNKKIDIEKGSSLS